MATIASTFWRDGNRTLLHCPKDEYWAIVNMNTEKIKLFVFNENQYLGFGIIPIILMVILLDIMILLKKQKM